MTPFHLWALRHQIPQAALADLLGIMGMVDPQPTRGGGEAVDESAVVNNRRLAAAREGRRIWRNNNGASLDSTGRMIRFGLGNDSAAVNKIFKSSDLIGVTPVTCRCDQVYGVFTAEECKRPGWKFTGTDREKAQLNFLNLVVSLGGIGRFTTGD